MSKKIQLPSKLIIELYTSEVAWYKQNGKYNDRITKDVYGNLYVIGDWSWNRTKGNPYEIIEPKMKEHINYNKYLPCHHSY